MYKPYFAAKLLNWLALASLLTGLILFPATPLSAGSNSGQIEPGAGKWQTWVVKSGSELRPDAPPDKAATQKELAELQALVAQRDAKALAQITYWDAGSPNYRWNEIALAQIQSKPISNPRIGRLFALLNVAIYDALITAWTLNIPTTASARARSSPNWSRSCRIRRAPPILLNRPWQRGQRPPF